MVVFKSGCVISDISAFFLKGGKTFWDNTPRQLVASDGERKKLKGEAEREREGFFPAVLIDQDPKVLIRARYGYSL